MEELSNRRRDLGKGIEDEKKTSWIISIFRYDLNFGGEIFKGGENVNPGKNKIYIYIYIYIKVSRIE
jgi:hypothetical protein